MDGEPETESASPFHFDETSSRCPMCGATVDSNAAQCPHCGEEQRPVSDRLTVPIFSLTAIGICTFFWSHITGMILVWLNCRRLELPDAALKTLLQGMLMTLVYFAVLFVLPDGNVSGIVLGAISVIVVTSYAKSVLKKPFAQQQQQGGPYRSIWQGHGIGCLVVIALLAVVFGLLTLLGVAGFEIE